MRRKLWSGLVAGVIGAALIAGALGGASCDDNSGGSATGTAGTSGSGGVGFDGGSNTSVYTVQLNGQLVVPASASSATATVVVTIDRTTGSVKVAGSYIGLSSNATSAAIRGPAPAGGNAGVLLTLTVPTTSSGTVSGSGTMAGAQMNDMTGGMTYISISSVNYPNGEIRGQIVP